MRSEHSIHWYDLDGFAELLKRTAVNYPEKTTKQFLSIFSGGTDITHLAISLMKHRLEDTFGPELSPYEVIGDPKDLHSAKALAEHDRYQFEWWALGKVAARPAHDKKKGADKGIDGLIYFFDDNSGKPKKIIVQVKRVVTSSGLTSLL